MSWLLGLLLAQAPGALLTPSGPWAVSRTDNGCQIVRKFGPDNEVALGFESTLARRNPFMLFVASKKVLPTGIGDLDVTLNGKDTAKIHYGSFDTTDPGLKILRFFPGTDELGRLADSSTLSIGKRPPSLQNPGTKAALNALDKCTVDLLTSLGVDPALYLNDKIARLKGTVSEFFSADAYPKEARAKRASGRVVLLLTSTPDGGIEACKVVGSADDSLNAGTCAIAVKHVKLTPPVDGAGRAMASYAILPIFWRAP